MADSLMKKLLDVIEDHDFVADADQEFVGTAASFLALAISRLPPVDREHTLKCIEDYGTLRRAVLRYPGARPSPYPSRHPYMH
jgi:hypothetical protein